MKYLENKSIEELKELRQFVSEFYSIGELLYELDSIISNKQKDKEKSLNTRFDITLFKKLNMFEPNEMKVLLDNNITNLQELIDCDLESLKGMLPSIKEKFLWAREFYNMDSFNNEGHIHKRK